MDSALCLTVLIRAGEMRALNLAPEGKKEDQKQGDHHREFKDDLRMKASLKVSVIQLSDTETSEQRFKVKNSL